jgi:hypothetical protein
MNDDAKDAWFAEMRLRTIKRVPALSAVRAAYVADYIDIDEFETLTEAALTGTPVELSKAMLAASHAPKAIRFGPGVPIRVSTF